MTHWVLLETNVLIGAYEPMAGNEQHASAGLLMRSLLKDPDIKLAITPLIRYEVLRGMRRVTVEKMNSTLNGFFEFEVGAADAIRAVEIYRLFKSKDTSVDTPNASPIDKRKFDVFHYVCAERNNLEIVSLDSDIGKIKKLVLGLSENA